MANSFKWIAVAVIAIVNAIASVAVVVVTCISGLIALVGLGVFAAATLIIEWGYNNPKTAKVCLLVAVAIALFLVVRQYPPF